MDLEIVYAHLSSLASVYEANGQDAEAKAVRHSIEFLKSRIWWEDQQRARYQ